MFRRSSPRCKIEVRNLRRERCSVDTREIMNNAEELKFRLTAFTVADPSVNIGSSEEPSIGSNGTCAYSDTFAVPRCLLTPLSITDVR